MQVPPAGNFSPRTYLGTGQRIPPGGSAPDRVVGTDRLQGRHLGLTADLGRVIERAETPLCLLLSRESTATQASSSFTGLNDKVRARSRAQCAQLVVGPVAWPSVSQVPPQ